MFASANHIRVALRLLLRQRTFAIAAVLSLGLAIALNTTMYAVIDALISPRVDAPHPDRLFHLALWGDPHNRVDGATRAALLRSGFRTYDALSSVALASRQPFALEHGARFTQAAIAYVAPNIFSVLEIRPVAGRAFTDADYTDASAPVVVTEGVARSLFGRGESPVGATIDVNGAPHPVIGVLGDAEHLPVTGFGAWMLPPPTTSLTSLQMNVIRLRPGSSPSDADHELATIAARIGQLAGLGSMGAAFRLSPMRQGQFRVQKFHIALVAAVVAVLLIACANLANLQLARGLARSRELALRRALGATRRDIVAQLSFESALLALGGLALGLLLTFWSQALLSAHIPPAVAEYIVEPQTSWRVFGVAVGATVVCLALVGLLPAIHVSSVDPSALLKSGAGTGANRSNRRKYSIMIVVEIGLSLALLSGTALLVRSAAAVSAVDVGYDIRPLVQASVIDRSAGGHVGRFVDVQAALVARLRSLQGSDGVAVEMRRSFVDNSVTVADVDGEKREIAAPTYTAAAVTPNFLRTLQIPVVAGRDFTEGAASEGELIIDEPTARYLWPNGRAVGGMIKLGSDSSHAPWVRVIGVVRGVRELKAWTFSHPEDAAPQGFGAIYYRPAVRDTFVAPRFGLLVTAFLRAAHDPERLRISARRALANAPPFQPVVIAPVEEAAGLRTMRESYAFVAKIFGLFTAIAVGLAAVGIYGIVAHSVAERRREIGVRIALGASPRAVLAVVLGEGNAAALSGLAVGLLLTKFTIQWLRAFSFENDQYDAPLFAVMAAVLFGVVAITALVPALRATRIDPVDAIRSE